MFLPIAAFHSFAQAAPQRLAQRLTTKSLRTRSRAAKSAAEGSISFMLPALPSEHGPTVLQMRPISSSRVVSVHIRSSSALLSSIRKAWVAALSWFQVFRLIAMKASVVPATTVP